LQRDTADADRFDLRPRTAGRRRRAPIPDGDVHAGARQRQRDGSAYPNPAASYERATAFLDSSATL
jgi:hypothetical protein